MPPCFSSCTTRIRFMLISLSSHTHKHTQRNEYEFECVLPQTFRQSANTTRNARVFHLKLCLQQQKQQLLKALSEDAHLLKRNQLIFILYCANGNRKAVALKAIWSAPFEYPGGSESIVFWHDPIVNVDYGFLNSPEELNSTVRNLLGKLKIMFFILILIMWDIDCVYYFEFRKFRKLWNLLHNSMRSSMLIIIV